jgi:cold shock CspA family protein
MGWADTVMRLISGRLFANSIEIYLRSTRLKTTGAFHQNRRISMSETWNKRERERNKQQKKKEKLERRKERKDINKGSHDLDSMLAYVDENGNLSSKPMDPKKKVLINAEDIDISVPKATAINPEDLIHTGIVTFFNNEKGYGFIKDLETQESVFVHATSLTEAVKENNKVSFEIEMGPKGANAIQVKIIRA